MEFGGGAQLKTQGSTSQVQKNLRDEDEALGRHPNGAWSLDACLLPRRFRGRGGGGGGGE